MFAVDRVRALAITNRPCQLPLGFDLEAYVRDALVVMRGAPDRGRTPLRPQDGRLGARSSMASQPANGAHEGRRPENEPARRRHPRAGRLDPELRQSACGS